MSNFDHRAVYIFCDGSMAYDSKSSGGIGYFIQFPESLDMKGIQEHLGLYEDANIERLEIEGIIQGMMGLLRLLKKDSSFLSEVSKIIVITDRYALRDEDRTSPFRIKEWRRNKGKNHEGKEIKNWDLLNNLDKTRNKLSNQARKSVRIEWKKRKENKVANKLSVKGRKQGISNRSIAIDGHKIGRRKFNGPEIDYRDFSQKEIISVNIFRKYPLKHQCEINAEICSTKKRGHNLKIYTDFLMEEKLQRGNEYEIKLKNIYLHHVEIYRTIRKIKREVK